MYVCLCNGFTDRDVVRCARQGACKPGDVYRRLGQPSCGKCLPTIRAVLAEAAAPAACLEAAD
ncbi:MAG: hypothetical protein OHK0024_16590 [Thalassobaculales bacterium]